MTSTESPTVPLGSTGLQVTELCIGTSALGDMPDTYGYDVTEERAHATVRAIFDSPINFLDTARSYGFGRSEERIGAVIRERSGLPDGFVLSTKADRDLDTNTFDASQVRRSVEQSMEALGLDHLQLVHLHDPEYCDLDEITRPGGAIDTLFAIRDEGLIDHVGLAAGNVEVMAQCLERGDFEVLLTHNRYTVLNRNADRLIDLANSKGVAVLNASPYGSGILARGTREYARYAYQDASEEIVAMARQMEDICARYDIPLAAAALQFSMRDPRVVSTGVGVSRPERMQQNLDLAAVAIPDAIWPELEALSDWDDDPEATRDYKPG